MKVTNEGQKNPHFGSSKSMIPGLIGGDITNVDQLISAGPPYLPKNVTLSRI
jgi:hypothetical protein